MNENLIKDLTTAVRELNNTLSGVLKVSTSNPGRAASHYVQFNGTFTGTNSLTIWTPSTGNRVVAKRVIIFGVVDTVLAASKPVSFYLADGGTGEVVAPISAAAATAAAGTLLPADGHPVQLDLGDGCPGCAADITLVVKADATIGTGVVRFFGVVLGTEVLP